MSPFAKAFVRGALALAAVLAIPVPALAQAWPAKPITIIVPFAPGGGSDFIGRFMAQRLSTALGQPVLVDNRPGAGSLLGIEVMSKAKPDGYTLGLVATSYAVLPSLYKMTFDPINDITPVIQISQGPMLLVANPNIPAKNVKELIEYAKKKPGGLNYASAGQGSITHLAGALFATMAGIKMTHVPYKGTGPALTDTISGTADIFFSSTATSLQHVKGGKLRAIGVTTTKRLPALPDVPTIAESGLPGYEAVLWHGLIGPKGMPKEVVERINGEVSKALKLKETSDTLEGDGVAPAGGSAAAFGAQIKRDIEEWGKVVKAAGVVVQ
ncbi:MAG: tripartite tricarboxylate transporter substrate binding protein [Betaproteobacteria bacterium]|nr:tripartite tricarboxylate transporter substrate binding protein [Betaproteobacteria bacterium]